MFTKARKQINFLTVLWLILFLAYPVNAVKAGEHSALAGQILKPVTIVTTAGSTAGAVSRMWIKDQSGTADDPTKYVLFSTPLTPYQGYRTYKLPTAVSPGDVINLKVSVNYKGLAQASQTWSWFLFDWVQNKWIKAGDNTGVVSNTWTVLQFTPPDPSRFVNNLSRQIRLQLRSNNATGNAKLDYEAITVTYQTCTDPLGCITIRPNSPIHISYLLSLDLGTESRNGASVAIDDAGGRILNHNIRFDGIQLNCDSASGLAGGARLAKDASIVAVVGTTCSVEAMAAMPVISQAGLVMVSPSNTNPTLTQPGNPNHHPGYLRVSWNDRVQGRIAAQFARGHLNLTKAATINDGSPYSVALQQSFASRFGALGGTITSQTTIDPNQTDFSAELAAIAAGTPDMIYMPVVMPAGGFLIVQARATAGLETAYLMSWDGLYTPDIVIAAGADVEGFLVTGMDVSQFRPKYTNHFVPAYLARFGSPPSEPGYAAHGYDAFSLIKAAIESVASVSPNGTIQIGRQALRDALYATRGFPALTGSLTCSPNGDCGYPALGVYEYHAGQPDPTKIWP
jgi:branched-chain amino acid transport system substrate-binding protein